jgi:hypothetical protein
MTDMLWSYVYSDNTAEPPTGNQIRFDATEYSLVTKVWIPYLTSDGIDIFYVLQNLDPDERLFVQDKNDHTRSVAFHVEGPPIDKTSYWEVPVIWLASVTLLTSGQAVMLLIAEPDVPLPLPLAELVTMPEAKDHLRITTTAQDSDLQLKIDEATAIVIDFLKQDADPAWMHSTVPLPVKAGILLMLTHLWEHRGDNMELDEKLWAALMNLLARFRAPTVA